MCGRFSLEVDKETVLEILKKEFHIQEIEDEKLYLHYNIAPGSKILAVIHDGKNYRAGLLHWGFVPQYAKDIKIGYKMINARSETVSEKSTFKDSFLNKRCLILADSFYEWEKQDNNKKKPKKIQVKDNKLFFMAGLWTSWKQPNSDTFFSTTIMTTQANEKIMPIHDRMPVIVSKENYKEWLFPKMLDSETARRIFTPSDPSEVLICDVDKAI